MASISFVKLGRGAKLGRLTRRAGLLVVLAWPGWSWASDVATLEILGFSQDGRRFGIVQSGSEDGSGSPYAVLEIASLPQAWALERNRIGVLLEPDGDASEATARAELLRISEGLLRALGMLSSAAAAAVPQPPFPTQPQPGKIELTDGRTLTLELSRQAVPEPSCRTVEAPAFAIEAILRLDGQVAGRRSFGPPPSECPLRFAIVRLQNALTADGHAAVGAVIAYERRGAEGATVSFFAVLLDPDQP